eukprot:Gregarina_sp_Poly_1__1934@NODE_1506_length_3978_cov_75_398619_g998_i0_p1_GENE_NODE_1506_length_3978_cov_75_398619_g998_i0NODE_1506_length_3978_cov_75_398619_g998_i0_p1_ORF_typecomplete_len638_score92_99tRNA_synthFbeta/PF17759_1/2_7e46B3_4/PF03483_17/1_3e26PhetRS_B1/PF18262_1/4_2e18PhetRS_B1/PF18262_1/1e04PhetRS_B1/PF18262_1/5_2e03B5/PF03484_15/4_7B5/PF03484_15/6_3e14_NODE_1506_length_3978_cov_75_398619_g998_i020063919
MPTVAVDSIEFHRRVGALLGLTDEYDLKALEQKVDEVCFNFGLEFDGLEEDENTKKTKLRIEVPANRYDLLCIESLCVALKYYLSPQPLAFPSYRHSVASPTHTMTVHASTARIRPYCVAAIFRNVTLGEAPFASFIDLQDKLHQNIGRRRTLVAIGTHNYDVLKGKNFTFEALPKKGGFHFVPLGQTLAVDGEAMFQLLENTYLKPYLPIVRDFDLTPVILDEARNVLSVPPIINSEFSKMAGDTTNIFVEITATDIRKAEIVLDTITAALSERLAEPFTVEPVKVTYADGHPGIPLRRGQEQSFASEAIVPKLNTEVFHVSLKYVRRVIGIENLTMDQALAILPKMMLRATDSGDRDTMLVECPISRRDILHPCDIAEDLAIGFGYNNIASRVHQAVTFQTIQNVSERVRREFAMAGWKECLTFGLVSLKDAYQDIRRVAGKAADCSDALYIPESVPAIVSEPKTRDFECIRPSLIAGILKTLASNQANELPIKLFEIGDCCSQGASATNGVIQRRHAGALIADHDRSGLEELHGLLDLVLKSLKLEAVYMQTSPNPRLLYRLTETQDGPFLDGRCVAIEFFPPGRENEAKQLGVMGVVHPTVLQNHGIPFPCSVFEITLEPALKWLTQTEMTAP